jgi:glycosyltransferase involved in cell wall biosynthesis
VSGVVPAVEARPVPASIRRGPPIVTVVIPGKNEASYARDCIQSLKDQTLPNFEAVIVDDCSTDSTLEVVLDAVGGDPRFRMVRTPRSVGIGLARNHGARIATTKYG